MFALVEFSEILAFGAPVLHYLRYVLAAFLFFYGFSFTQEAQIQQEVAFEVIGVIMIGTGLWLVFGF
ncbi:MAG: hypothetical protein O2795_20690 [Acidobacteria bacterium]|nr:hypothetical protein [Acidobacteriota bacterium]